MYKRHIHIKVIGSTATNESRGVTARTSYATRCTATGERSRRARRSHWFRSEDLYETRRLCGRTGGRSGGKRRLPRPPASVPSPLPWLAAGSCVDTI
ncbi:unnamed protein product [Pieris brassicae]|uniref:Uncharacterized protein n=1 Tax=Pieris brassicae TaxID=7116 RepID=A0A9P0X6B2_PIEBR|nr:unnamed protein product [Pieris brassicae]